MLYESDAAGQRWRLPQGKDPLLGVDAAAWGVKGFWAARLHPEDRERVLAARPPAARSGQAFSLRYRLLKLDGTQVDVEETGVGARTVRGALVDVGPRRDAESRLRIYREVFRRSSDGIALIDLSGRYIEQNGAHSALLGYTASDLAGKTPAIHLGSEAFTRIADELAKTGVSRGEFESRRKDGGSLAVELSAFTIRDEAGAPLCHAGIKRDVTERHRREKQIRFHSVILNSVGQAVVATDPAGAITFWNEGARRLHGWRVEEILGRSILDLVRSDGKERAAAMLARLAEGEEWTGEMDVLRRDGTSVPAIVAFATVRDDSGGVAGFVAVTTEIADHKAAEERLRRHLAQVQGINGLSDAVGRAVSLEELQSAALDALERALGVRRAAILLADDAGVFRFTAWRGLSEAYRRAVDGHSPWSRDVVDPSPVLVADVEADPALADYRAILRRESIRALGFFPLTSQGRLLGKFMVYHGEPHVFTRDEVAVARTVASHIAFGISRRRAERELEAARRQVAVSEKMAALGSLVSGVAHEVRTPLTYLANNVFLARHRLEKARALPATRSLADDVAPCLDAAAEGVDRINRLVTELRPFARLKGGRVRAGLGDLVRGAVELFRATHRGETAVEADLQATPDVECDREQMQQVVLNLLDNASDAKPRDGVVRVATRCEGNEAVLVVEDHGVGMPAEVKARIFDPFFTTKAEGTGLGLSIVRRIVDAHNGTIEVDSELRLGTRVVIRLPLLSP